MRPLVGVAWETFQESYSAPPQVASEEKGKSNRGLGGKELEIHLGCHQVYPWCLHDRTGRDEYTACVSKGQTKSSQGRKALVENLSTPPSRARKNASGRKMVLVTFFLPYNWELTISASVL